MSALLVTDRPNERASNHLGREMSNHSTSLVKHSKRTLRAPECGCPPATLYKGHDTENTEDLAYCAECGVYGTDVFLNLDGSIHVHPHNGSAATDNTGETMEHTFQSAAVDASITRDDERQHNGHGADDTLEAIKLLKKLFGSDTVVDRDQVAAIAREVIGDYVFPTNTVVMRDSVAVKVDGLTHNVLADVIETLDAGEHVMLVGPAGTGKSTIAHQAATALGMTFYSISLSAQTPASAFLGYMNANGGYVSTLFREAYEHGGLFNFDEIDNGHPNILAVINSALSNGTMAFPDHMVDRHPDFKVTASANTYGLGATREYVGRNAIDAATLDRFAIIDVPIDDALESAMVRGTGVDETTGNKVLDTIRAMRTRAESNGIRVILSPRASQGMAKQLARGRTWDKALASRVRRGLDDATWKKIAG